MTGVLVAVGCVELFDSIAGGNAPDLAWIGDPSRDLMASDALVGLTDKLKATPGWEYDDLEASATKEFSRDGTLCAYPFSTSPYALYVNTDLLAKAGQKIDPNNLTIVAGVPRRAWEAAISPCTALAVIESLEAVESEATSDVAVRFERPAPDDTPAYRVAFTQDINLADLPDYRPGGVMVVQYPSDRPWRVRIVRRPTPEWEERATGARLHAAPGPVLVSEPSGGCAVGSVTLLAAAGLVLLFRTDLFDEGASAHPPSSTRPSARSPRHVGPRPRRRAAPLADKWPPKAARSSVLS